MEKGYHAKAAVTSGSVVEGGVVHHSHMASQKGTYRVWMHKGHHAKAVVAPGSVVDFEGVVV